MKRGKKTQAPAEIVLGSWVELPDSGDIGGVVVEIVNHVDTTTRYGVHYWHNGERKFVNCERRELRAAQRPPDRRR